MMKKLIVGMLSVGMVFFSSCSSEDGDDGIDTSIVNVDPDNVNAETLNGVWEVVSSINDDDDEQVNIGEEYDYFEGENCPEKPYSRDVFIGAEVAFVGSKSYSRFESSEQKYIYDDVEMNDDYEFKNCDTSGKKLGVKEEGIYFSVDEIHRVVVVGNTIYYVEKELDYEGTKTYYSTSRIIIDDVITLESASETDTEVTDLTTLSYEKRAILKKISNTVDLSDFNNGVEAWFVNGEKVEEE